VISNPTGSSTSLQRKLESIVLRAGALRAWIPAFAGMTEAFAGMT
jgi:hypothetical protein